MALADSLADSLADALPADVRRRANVDVGVDGDFNVDNDAVDNDADADDLAERATGDELAAFEATMLALGAQTRDDVAALSRDARHERAQRLLAQFLQVAGLSIDDV